MRIEILMRLCCSWKRCGLCQFFVTAAPLARRSMCAYSRPRVNRRVAALRSRPALLIFAADVRWWSAACVFRGRQTGNPVQFRDGPAAVTERRRLAPSKSHCRYDVPDRHTAEGEKAGPAKLGSQKTYQRGTESFVCEGQARRRAWLFRIPLISAFGASRLLLLG